MRTDPRRMLFIPKQCPFTLLMLMALIVAGIYGRTHVGSLDVDVRHRVGYSPRLLLNGHLHRPFTSVLFTAGGWRFYASLLMVALTVGWIECSHGTRRALLTFFGVHLLTLLILGVGVALPLVLLGTHRGTLLFDAQDVGPSAGYYGCLGLAVAGLPGRKRKKIVFAVLAVLLLRLVWSTAHIPEEGRTMSADLAHLTAFPLGLLCYRLNGNRRRVGDE